MSSHNASRATQDASSSITTPDSDPSTSQKAYHATAEWGKRGMTLQELTRAFDAFNEAEERVALGFAGSEDCNRTLAEPLSEVKTVFLDLDGLKPMSGCHSFTPVTPSVTVPSQRNNGSQILHVNISTKARERNECHYIMRTDVVSISTSRSASPAHDLHPDINVDHRLDEDTIKVSHKRRRSLLTPPLLTPPLLTPPLLTPPLLTSSALPTSSNYSSRFEDGLEIGIPSRPHSRLGFADDECVNEYEREDGEDTPIAVAGRWL